MTRPQEHADAGSRPASLKVGKGSSEPVASQAQRSEPSLSEDDLIALEDALANFQAAAADYECGLCAYTDVHRMVWWLEAACKKLGMAPGSDCEAFADQAIKAPVRAA